MARTVVVIPSEIANFRKSWPCSGLPHYTGITFEYAANGDLTGYAWTDGGDHWEAEQSGAMLALTNDAWSGKIGTPR